MTEEETGARVDRLFELLANRRRRAMIAVLRATPRGEIDRDSLVDGVVTLTDVSEDRRDEIEVELYHVHLPKLAAAGLVERGDGEISYDPSPLVERCLDLAEIHEDEAWMNRSVKV